MKDSQPPGLLRRVLGPGDSGRALYGELDTIPMAGAGEGY